MVFDQMENILGYKGLGKNYDTAIDWLKKTDLSKLEVGKIVIDGDEVYASIQAYDTKAYDDAKFETHKSYSDIQIIIDGKETIGYAPINSLKESVEYNATKDVTFYDNSNPGLKIPMNTGDFCIFMPQDGHKPKADNAGVSAVKKAVIKIKIV